MLVKPALGLTQLESAPARKSIRVLKKDDKGKRIRHRGRLTCQQSPKEPPESPKVMHERYKLRQKAGVNGLGAGVWNLGPGGDPFGGPTKKLTRERGFSIVDGSPAPPPEQNPGLCMSVTH